MKKIAIALVAIMSLLASGSLRAAESGKCGDNITWTLDDAGNLVLTGHGAMHDYAYSPWYSNRNNIKIVKISNSITGISDYAFDRCENLASVELPSSLTCIGDYVFYGCKSLTRMAIPSGVTSIGRFAFEFCESLTSIDLPSGLTSIGESVFFGCKSLTRIDLPSGLTSIGESAFSMCKSLTSIDLPSGVASIGDYAFDFCESLTSIDLPSGLKSIGERAFLGCRSLTSIEIPSHVSSIGDRAFSQCSGLESITVEDGNWAYDSRRNCNAIIETSTNALLFGCKNTVIPKFVKSIADGAFDECIGLTSITIPYGVTTIGDRAFEDCKNLTSLSISSSVTAIGEDAFMDCSKLESIVVDGDNPVFDSRDNCNAIIETQTNTLFLGCKGTAIPSSVVSIGDSAFDGSGLASIVIPDGVTAIRDYAFHDCADLESVTLGRNVEFVGEHSFYDCEGLNRIELLSTVPPRAKNFYHNDFDDVAVFDYDTYYTCQLIVPDEAIDAYRRTAPWAYFDHVAGVEDVIADGGVAVTADGNSITVNGAGDDAEVEVYGVSGALVYRGASHSIAVPAAGIYVVRVAGKAVKVAVK